ncbi:hypothetical protein [Streptomyces sp. MJP52]|uniref:hypothetical protein n=1 Tax=Streptomyces sp. MJP52 TaxID=2940555 RepID=UPI0024754830|nr:hypothetical protein [Streptomyces sp. MJP52]MDH6228744.1 hypothetical protein [Streptomyces sp. MJP52]
MDATDHAPGGGMPDTGTDTGTEAGVPRSAGDGTAPATDGRTRRAPRRVTPGSRTAAGGHAPGPPARVR